MDDVFNSTTITNASNSTSSQESSPPLHWPDILNSLICLAGLITVSINISIFANPTLKDPTYKLLLCEAVSDFLYLLCSSLWPIFNYAVDENSLARALYTIAIDDYLTSSLAINDILIELFLSVDRLLILSNRVYLQNLPLMKTILVLNATSLLVYVPVLFLKRIVAVYSSSSIGGGFILVGYSLQPTSFGQTNFGLILPSILSVLRLCLVIVCLFTINLVTLVKFRRHVKRKSKLVVANRQDTNMIQFAATEASFNANNNSTSSNHNNNNNNRRSNDSPTTNQTSFASSNSKRFHFKPKRNLTLTVVSISFLFTIGTLPWAFYTILSDVAGINASFLDGFGTFAVSCLFLLILCKIFIYFLFNRFYRLIFKRYFHSLCSLLQIDFVKNNVKNNVKN